MENIKGRIWLITDNNGAKIDSIDTDMIFHNQYLHITDIDEMGQYTFDNLTGWKDFSTKAKPDDIVIVGENFGAGSSRQQAVDCFISLGVRAIIGESFGAIYKRNVINTGFPLIEAPGIFDSGFFATGDNIEIDIESGIIKNLSNNKEFNAKPVSNVASEIAKAGGIFKLK